MGNETLAQEWEAAAPDLTAEWDAAAPAAEPPSNLAVAGQSVVKGLASGVDMFAGAPGRAVNLGLAGAGYAAGELGRPDIAADMPLVPRGFSDPAMTALQNLTLPVGGKEVLGPVLSPDREPQTAQQRVMDRVIQAGVQSVLVPQQTLGGLIKTAATLALSGLTGGVTKEALRDRLGEKGSDYASFLAQLLTPLAVRSATSSNANKLTLENPVKSATLKEAQEAGFVVPPSSVKPSFMTNRVESIAGKAATEQQSNITNQAVANKQAALELGLADDMVTPTSLKAYQEAVTEPFRRVAALSPQANSVWERLKTAREEAQLSWKEANGPNHPKAARLEAQKFDAQAKVLEGVLERTAKKHGEPGLMEEVREARKQFAKSKNIQEAMNVGSGDIDLQVLGRMLDRGVPLSGRLGVMARFANAFPKVTRDAAGVTAPGVGYFEPALAIGGAAAGYAASGGEPEGLLLGLPGLARGVARTGLLSRSTMGLPGTTGYQGALLKPPTSLMRTFGESVLAGRSAADIEGAQ